MESWYIRNEKKIYGPYTEEQISKFIEEQKILPQHHVSNDQATWHSSQQFAMLRKSQTKNIAQVNKNMIGKYEIIRELGRGGMGVVYEAIDTSLGRKCAIKVILGVNDERSKKRFFAEAQAIAKLDHPNIIRIQEMKEFIDQNGVSRSLFVMDYVQGKTLEKIIQENELNLKQKLQIFQQICEGMAHAHERKIIHRDLKPLNVIVADELIPTIIDFGFARKIDISSEITKTGELFGTPQYMAPESISGKKIVDTGSDIYALGVILYKILTGRVPFMGDDIIGVLFQITTMLPTSPSLLNPEIKKDSDIEIICLKCLEKEPSKRIRSCQFLAQEITNIIHHRPIKTKPLGLIPRFFQKLRYDKTSRALVAVTMLVLLLTYLTYTRGKAIEESENQRKIAEEKTQVAEEKTQVAEEKTQVAEEKTQVAEFEKLAKDVTNARKNINNTEFYRALEDIKTTVNSLDDFFQKNKKNNLGSKGINPQKIFTEFQTLLKFAIMPNLPKIEQVYQIDTIGKRHLTISNRLHYISYLDEAKNQMVLFDIKNQKEKIVPSPEKDFYTPFSFSNNEKYLILRHTIEANNKKNPKEIELFHYIYNIETETLLPHKIFADLRSTKKSIEFSPDSLHVIYNDEKGLSIISLQDNTKKSISSIKARDFVFSKDYLAFFPYKGSAKNKSYYIYDFKSKQTIELGKWEQIFSPSIACNYEKNIFYLNSKHIIERYQIEYRGDKLSIQKEDVVNISPHVTDKFRIIIPSEDETLAYGAKKDILLMRKIEHIKPKYYYHYKNTLPAEVQNIFFFSSRILASYEKGDSIHLLDTISQNFLYYQQEVASFFSVGDYFILVSKNINPNNGHLFATYSRFFWEKNLITKYSLQGENLKHYKLLERYLYSDESVTKSYQVLFLDVDDTITMILPSKRGFMVWQGSRNTYEEKLYFSASHEVSAVAISTDKKMLAVVLNDKKQMKQKVVLVRIKDLITSNIFEAEAIIEDQKLKNGDLIRIDDQESKDKDVIDSIEFSSDSKELYITYDKEIYSYSISQKKSNSFTNVSLKVNMIKKSLEHELVAIAQNEGIIDIVDKKGSSQWQGYFPVESFNDQQKHDADIVKAAWHPQQKMIAFANIAGQTRVWHCYKNKWQNFLSVEEEKKLNFAEEIYNLSFSPDGKYLAIFTFENIYIYDLEYKYYVESYIGYHKGGLAIFSDDWKYCILPTTDSKMLLFDQRYFLNNAIYQDKIKDKGHDVYFKDKSKNGDDTYWPLRLQRKFQEYIK